MTYDKLLYGKSDIERIVSLEVKDEFVELFVQDNDGNISVEHRPHRYWLLSPEKINKKWVQLKGDLHYKYGFQTTDKREFYTIRRWAKREDKDIYSIYDSVESTMIKDGYTLFKGMKREEVSVLAFDIESTSLKLNDDAKVLLIANTFRNSKGEVSRKLFCYNDYTSEGEMIKAWCDWVREIDPSVIVGHNIYSYDLPYLEFVANKYNQSLALGRDGSNLFINTHPSEKRYDGSRSVQYKKCRIYGRQIIDTMFLAYTYDVASRKYESYGLKSIIKQEGLEVSGRQFYDADQIRFRYKDPVEWKKIKDYAINDGDDALSLYDLMSPSFFYLTQMVPKSFQQIVESASGSQLNAMLIRSYLQDGNSIPKANEIKKVKGAISFGIPGVYKNIFKQDLQSLYPSIILQYKLYDKDKDPNGHFLKICETITHERLKNKEIGEKTKDPYYINLEQSMKITANSLYGLTNTEGLNFNCSAISEFITSKAREILSTAILWATSKPVDLWLEEFEKRTN